MRMVMKLVHAYQKSIFLSYFLPLLPLSLLCVDRHNPPSQQASKKNEKKKILLPLAASPWSRVASMSRRGCSARPTRTHSSPSRVARRPTERQMAGGFGRMSISRMSLCARPKCTAQQLMPRDERRTHAMRMSRGSIARLHVAHPPKYPTRGPDKRYDNSWRRCRSSASFTKNNNNAHKNRESFIPQTTDLDLPGVPLVAARVAARMVGCPPALANRGGHI